MEQRGHYGETPAEKLGSFVDEHFSNLWPFLGLAVISWGLYVLWNRVDLYNRRQEFSKKHGCQPCNVMPNGIGFRFLRTMIKANADHTLLSTFHGMLAKYGRTFEVHGPRRYAMITNDAENIKTVIATKFEDWGVQEIRREATIPLLGDGIFTTDGKFWAHSRAMLRPAFEKSQVADLNHFEHHTSALLANIPKDGSTVDLQELFHQISMDLSSDLLMGKSTNSLAGNNLEARRFIENFEYSMVDMASRSRLGPMYHMVPHFKAWKAIRETRQFVDVYVEEAMKVKNALIGGSEKSQGKTEKGKYTFLAELAKNEEVDANRIRNETLNVMLAGRDTTASLLSNLFFVLARQPEVWKKLQVEVDELGGELPTYEKLRDMKYLKYCVQETLRLWPPVPVLARMALRDTVLPRGGGPEGHAPIFVPKGTVMPYISYSLHRNKEVYGEDAEEFKPDRWANPNLRPGWNSIPFGGGPRVCLGQQYALTETYYVTIRLMQTFRKLEARDPEPWIEKLAVTCCSLNGTKVALTQ